MRTEWPLLCYQAIKKEGSLRCGKTNKHLASHSAFQTRNALALQNFMGASAGRTTDLLTFHVYETLHPQSLTTLEP